MERAISSSWSATNRVLEVTTTGIQSTVYSGSISPFGIAVDGAGDIFILAGQQLIEISPGGVQTVLPWNATINPAVLTINAAGDILLAGSGATSFVDKYARSTPPSFSFAPTPGGQTSSDSPQSMAIQNIGNQPLNALTPGLSIGANFGQILGSGDAWGLQQQLLAGSRRKLQPEHRLHADVNRRDQQLRRADR